MIQYQKGTNEDCHNTAWHAQCVGELTSLMAALRLTSRAEREFGSTFRGDKGEAMG